MKIRELVRNREKQLGYKGCKNCKNDIRTCNAIDGRLHFICPKWERRVE